MNIILKQFKQYFDKTIKDASKLFGFIDHVNSHQMQCEKLYPSTKNLNEGISNVITCKDLVYFTFYQARHNETYASVNSKMLCEKLTCVTSGAYKKQRQRKSPDLFKFIYERLVEFHNKEFVDKKTSVTKKNNLGITNKKRKLIPTSYDGSHYTLLKTKSLIDDGIPTYNEKTCRTAINGMLNNESGILEKVRFLRNSSEQVGFLKDLEDIEENKLLIVDRLYYTEIIHRKIKNKKCEAIFRLQDKTKYVHKFIKSKKVDTIINLLDNKQVKRGTDNAIQLRMVKYVVNDTLYIIGTTLLNKNKYTLDFLKMMYYCRWEIEEFFKILNFNLSMKESNARSFNTFQQDVYAKLIIITISKIISSIATEYSPVKLRDDYKINFNNCMTIVSDYILKQLLYTSDKQNEIKEFERLVQIVRNETIKSEEDRHFPRISARPSKKWYHEGYRKEHSKKLKKIKSKKDNKIKKYNKKAAPD